MHSHFTHLSPNSIPNHMPLVKQGKNSTVRLETLTIPPYLHSTPIKISSDPHHTHDRMMQGYRQMSTLAAKCASTCKSKADLNFHLRLSDNPSRNSTIVSSKESDLQIATCWCHPTPGLCQPSAWNCSQQLPDDVKPCQPSLKILLKKQEYPPPTSVCKFFLKRACLISEFRQSLINNLTLCVQGWLKLCLGIEHASRIRKCEPMENHVL